MAGRPDFKYGDKVSLDRCPQYPSIETHTAKVLGEPQNFAGEWWIPVRYWCMGKKNANVRCRDVVKIRSIRVKLSKAAISTAIFLGILAIVGLWLVGNYNSLVRARNDVNNSRAKIDTELTRRYDLIDNIVASVKGSQVQESEVFGKIAEARKIGGSASDQTSEQAQNANAVLDQQIAFLPRLQEAYPELRSNDQVTRLIQELQGTNNTIRDKRNEYNDTVTNYNNNVTSFPKSVFAAIFNFDQAKLFEATAQEKVNPKVDLTR